MRDLEYRGTVRAVPPGYAKYGRNVTTSRRDDADGDTEPLAASGCRQARRRNSEAKHSEAQRHDNQVLGAAHPDIGLAGLARRAQDHEAGDADRGPEPRCTENAPWRIRV